MSWAGPEDVYWNCNQNSISKDATTTGKNVRKIHTFFKVRTGNLCYNQKLYHKCKIRRYHIEVIYG